MDKNEQGKPTTIRAAQWAIARQGNVGFRKTLATAKTAQADKLERRLRTMPGRNRGARPA